MVAPLGPLADELRDSVPTVLPQSDLWPLSLLEWLGSSPFRGSFQITSGSPSSERPPNVSVQLMGNLSPS